mgnify:FL=1
MQSYLKTPSLRDVLSDPKFSLPKVEVILSLNKIKGKIRQKYPNFQFDDLDDNGLSRMAGFSSKLDGLSAKVVDLAKSGRTKEAHILARKIKLLNDPVTSAARTPIEDVMEATHGDFDAAAAFLGLIDVGEGRDWLEFIVRTWGKKPLNYK